MTLYERAMDEYYKSIRRAMVDREVTQKDIAREVHRDQATVSRRIKKIDNMAFGDMWQLAHLLGLEIIIRKRGSKDD